jgi:hypothetical protein
LQYYPIIDAIDHVSAECLQPAHFSLHVIGFDIQVDASWASDSLERQSDTLFGRHEREIRVGL